jgi:hypothetical protein
MSAHPSSYAPDLPAGIESQGSGVSWGAILVGALVAAAMALTLSTLGVGIGLSSMSAWLRGGAAASHMATAAILWMIVVQAMSAAIGGYVAGRLRTKWVNVHSDEVYFRDTAHGFAAWAVSVAFTAALIASTATSAPDGAGRLAARASSESAGSVARSATIDSPGAASYYADALLRSPRPAVGGNDAALRSELARVLANGLHDGQLSATDQAYLAHVVSDRTGLSGVDAAQRVTAVVADANAAAVSADATARAAADVTRQAAQHAAYWLFTALLLGAFLASFAATIGGRQRDRTRRAPLPYTLT